MKSNHLLLIIYFTSFSILSWNKWAPTKRNPKIQTRPTPYIIEYIHSKMRISYDKPEIADLHLSYTTGFRKWLNKSTKKNHKILNLMHLFTPSGIHLAGFYLILSPLLYFLKGRKKLIVQLLLCVFTFFLPGFFSIKRISMIKALFSLKNYHHWNISLTQIFFISFVIDFIGGSFDTSPLSWTFSFLFLGIFVCLSTSAPIATPLALMGGQIIICFFNGSTFYPVGALLGMALTFIFSIIFPIIFINLWLFILWEKSFSYSILSLYSQLIDYAAQVTIQTVQLVPSVPLILIVFFYTFFQNYLIFFILLVHSEVIF